MKKLFYMMSFVALGLFSACTDYAEDIKSVNDRLDKLEQGRISTIEQQITVINGSIDDLKAVDTELGGYIDALQNTANDLQSQIDATNDALAALESDLEGQITASEQKVLSELNTVKSALEGQLATINNTIATLQAKDAELGQRIIDLQTYIDNEITATEDWASATFSTLEQYEATQTAISEINALIKATQESITALEEKLSKKIADDIAAAVAEVNATIAAKVQEITDAYTAAIATAKEDITAAYTDAIKTAITASETSMKEWVNGVLADGYYNKAEIDGKITALQTKVAEADAALQKEIDDLKEALAKAESDLTEAYKKAIADAITENNGKITEQITAAVETAQNNLQEQIDAIFSEIEKINVRLDIIEADINSINQQIDAINGSIDDLKRVDGELKSYIDALQNTANDLQSTIDAANDALAALESDLEGQITASEQKVLSELNTVKSALEGQLATINNTITTLTSQLTAIEGKITSLESAVAECATQADLDVVKQELATVHSDMAAMITAIKDLQDRMATVEGEVASLQEKVKDLEDRIADLENNFANRIQSLKYLPEYNDGKATMDYSTRTMTLDFIISPAALATSLKQQFDADNGVIKAYVRYTKTRAAGDIVEQKVSAMSVGENGLFTLTIEEQNISEEFWTGALGAVIYVQIIDQNGNDVVSDMIPMVVEGHASSQLATPSNVKVEQISRGIMRVSWDPVPNADYYEFYRGGLKYEENRPITSSDNYHDFEYSERFVGLMQDFAVKAASNSSMYTTSEPYESSFEFTELLPEATAKTIEYVATEQLTLTEGVFGDGVTYTHSFADGKGTITFDSSVTEYSIANYAFSSCQTLESITFSEGLTLIGSRAFSSCLSLEKVVIRGNVDEIKPQAFAFCVNLVIFEYYGITEPIVEDLFLGSTALPFVSVTDAYHNEYFDNKEIRRVL